MIVIAEDSVRFAHSGPSHNLLRPAIAELVSCGPLPLPVSGGGHASAIPSILPSPSPLPSSPYSYLHYRYPLPSSCLALPYSPSLYPSLWQDKPRHVTTPLLHFEIQKKVRG